MDGKEANVAASGFTRVEEFLEPGVAGLESAGSRDLDFVGVWLHFLQPKSDSIIWRHEQLGIVGVSFAKANEMCCALLDRCLGVTGPLSI